MPRPLPTDLAAVDPADAWAAWSPSAGEPWDRSRAAHLFRRAAFGPAPADLDRAAADGFPKTLDRLMAGEPDAADRWAVLADVGSYCKTTAELRAWWLYAMIEGGHPLREKLTLFWHNHFATSDAKVRSTALMYGQNVALRTHALGRFRPLLLAVSRDPATLVWLDSNRNVKAAPNENYAREVMELFSLGVGNYTEADVREAARAFTGWHTDPEESAFEFNPAFHDAGSKTVFGATGPHGGADVVKLCCDRPACARFLAGKLYGFLVNESPPPKGLLAPLAERLRRTDYDLADLVRTVLGSRLFFSPHAARKRVKWPVEYVLGAVRAVVPGRLPPGDLLEPLAKMGQTLFAPPNVKGWRTGTDWLNSATLLARNNFAEAVAMGNWSRSRGAAEGAVATADAAATATAVEADGLERIGVDFEAKPDPLAAVVGPTAAAARPAKPSPPPKPTLPPAPTADRDPLGVVFAARPATVPALVARMGDVLFGEGVPPAARKKIEAFLLDGQPAVTATGMADPAFRHRAREALHAMMCLPEYQLC